MNNITVFLYIIDIKLTIYKKVSKLAWEGEGEEQWEEEDVLGAGKVQHS